MSENEAADKALTVDEYAALKARDEFWASEAGCFAQMALDSMVQSRRSSALRSAINIALEHGFREGMRHQLELQTALVGP